MNRIEKLVIRWDLLLGGCWGVKLETVRWAEMTSNLSQAKINCERALKRHLRKYQFYYFQLIYCIPFSKATLEFLHCQSEDIKIFFIIIQEWHSVYRSLKTTIRNCVFLSFSLITYKIHWKLISKSVKNLLTSQKILIYCWSVFYSLSYSLSTHSCIYFLLVYGSLSGGNVGHWNNKYCKLSFTTAEYFESHQMNNSYF